MTSKTKIWEILLPGIIAGLFSFAGIFFASVYTQDKAFSNKRKEALLEIDKNRFDRSQKFYLNYMDFAEKCLHITSYNASDDLKELKIPTISQDSLLKKQWLIQADKLTTYRDSVDYRIFYAFQSIMGLYNKNPFPNFNFKDSIKINHWYTNNLFEEWVKDAGYLKYLINKKLNLEIDESYY